MPVELDLFAGKDIRSEHFEMISEMPVKRMVFDIGFEAKGIYCPGFEKLQQLDSLTLRFHSQAFLKDIAKLENLEYLELELFHVDTSIKERPDFNYLKKLRITLSRLENLSCVFGSLPALKQLDFTKNDMKLNLFSSMPLLNNSPLELLCIALTPLDTTGLNTISFPYLRKLILFGTEKNINHSQFILNCPKLELLDFTGCGMTKEYTEKLQERFPGIKISRDY
ncbi:MAG: hypothetical protein ACOZCO_02845 [Bacteroidota bacterium]